MHALDVSWNVDSTTFHCCSCSEDDMSSPIALDLPQSTFSDPLFNAIFLYLNNGEVRGYDSSAPLSRF